MPGTRNRGPYIALGPLLDGTAAPGPYDGSSMFYQGEGLLDPRYSPANKDSQNSALFPGWAQGGTYELVNAIPSAAGTATVAVAQNAVSATAFAFITASPGTSHPGVPSIVTGLPLVPFQGSSAVTVFALDFGFTTGTTTAGSTTIASIPDTSILRVGQWICVGGVGNAAKSSSQLVQIVSIGSPSTVVVNAAMVASLTGAPVGSANQFNASGFYPNPAQMQPTGVTPYMSGGESLVFDPRQSISRAVSISGGAATTGGTFTVAGYDVYGVVMHENIVASTAGTTIYGKKAFKYLTSVTPQFADAHPYTVGTSDVYGFPLFSGTFESMDLAWNGNVLAATAGWITGLAFSTGTATFATADVRGTLQTSANGGGAASASSTVSDGNLVRLYVAITLGINHVVAATNTYTVPLLGLAQV